MDLWVVWGFGLGKGPGFRISGLEIWNLDFDLIREFGLGFC